MGRSSARSTRAAKIGLELRNQYALGYAPLNQERDGKYRRLQVKLISPRRLTAAPDLSQAGLLRSFSLGDLTPGYPTCW